MNLAERIKIITDLGVLKGTAPTTKEQKAKITQTVNNLQAGDFDADKPDFPASRLHAELLVIGDTEILYKFERDGYK